MRRGLLLGFTSLAALGTAAGLASAQDAAPTRTYTPVTDEMILDPAPGDWLQWRRTVNNWGFSPLDQINRDILVAGGAVRPAIEAA